MNPVKFTIDDAQKASDEWGFNCGPGALCAVMGMTPEEIRPHLLDFERKGYTNPTLMNDILRGLNIEFQQVFRSDEPHKPFPFVSGLVRLQFGGPWTKPGVPMQARYLHTHWVGVGEDNGPEIFDINAMCSGGWLTFREWSTMLIPWLIKETTPKADGKWWATHGIEVRL